MKQRLERILIQCGFDPTGLNIEPCHGGDINEAFRCRTDSDDLFVKLRKTDDEQFFSGEILALNELSSTGGLQVPAFRGSAEADGWQALILGFIPMQRLSADGYRKAGKRLAQCHRATQSRFGWHADNLIGVTPQKNSWAENWPLFFIEQRLWALVDALNDRTMNRYRDALTQFRDACDGYSPEPSLLHGDLWAGNLAADETGEPVFYDPASYYGDRETDLALTELFGGFPAEFYQGYQSVWPLDAGYERRKDWYQLYHILNHALIFGGHYRADARQRIRRLVNES